MDRDKSQSPNQNPASHSIDPVLARYHAIKKQMEENGGSIYATPPPSNVTTPRRAAGGSNNISISLNNQQRIGTPAPGPSQPPPPPHLSLYTAVLTPDEKRSGSTSFQKAFQTQYQQQQQSNATGSGRTSPVPSVRISTLATNIAASIGPSSEMELEAARRRTHELDQTRRQLAVERDVQREKTAELESRLQLEAAATAEATSHVKALKSESDRTNRLLESLQLDLVARNNEITALRERQIHLERKLLDAEAELVHGGGATSQRVLAGKVSALEDLLKSKQFEIEEEQRKTRQAQNLLEEERQRAEDMAQKLQNKDREIGEIGIALRDSKRAKERVDARVNEIEIIEREMEQKCQDLEDKIRAAAESSEIEIRQHKEELRQKTREIQRLEVKLAGYEEEVKEMTATKVQLERDVEAARQLSDNSTREARTWQARQEALTVLQVSETTAKEEAQREVQRLKEEQKLLHDELRAHVKQCEQYEQLLGDADKEREIKEALEAQVRVLQSSFSRQEEDLKSMQIQLESDQRKIAHLEESAMKVAPLEKKAAEMQALAELRLEQINKAKSRETLLEAELDSTSENLRSAKQEAEDAKRDFVMSHERCLQLQNEIVNMEHELSLLGEAQEKLAHLNDALENRQAQIHSLQIEVSSWQSRFREADAEATNLRSVQLRLQSTEDKLAATLEQVAQREDTIKALERKVATQNQSIREHEDERQIFANEKATLEHEIARLNGFVSDKQTLESRLRGAINELQSRQDELNRERNRIIDLQSRLHERDDAAVQERQKRGEFESLAHSLQGEVTKMQQELGRVTVMLDSCQKEKQRFEVALENRTRDLVEKQDALGRLERMNQEKDEELRLKQIQDNNVRHEIELSELKMRELGNQLAAARKTVEEQKELVRRADAERRELQSRAENLVRLEDKLNNTESSLVSREDEIANLHQQNLQLKQKIKELQSEITGLKQSEQRVVELKALLERQNVHLENSEREDANKSQKIIEKERELGRVREKLASVTGELDSERLRRSQAENSARELESASSKAVQLEGQLAGLNQVLNQRAKDLEEARALVSELRERMRNAGVHNRSASSTTNLATAELDAKLRAKDETIARLEAEEQRRSHFVDQLRRDIAARESEKAHLERQVQDLQTQIDRADVSWRARCTRLENELGEMAKRNPVTDSKFRRMEEELLDAKVRNQTLQEQIDRLKRELANKVGGGGGDSVLLDHPNSSISRYGAASSRLQTEMNRTRASLERDAQSNSNNNRSAQYSSSLDVSNISSRNAPQFHQQQQQHLQSPEQPKRTTFVGRTSFLNNDGNSPSTNL